MFFVCIQIHSLPASCSSSTEPTVRNPSQDAREVLCHLVSSRGRLEPGPFGEPVLRELEPSRACPTGGMVREGFLEEAAMGEGEAQRCRYQLLASVLCLAGSCRS